MVQAVERGGSAPPPPVRNEADDFQAEMHGRPPEPAGEALPPNPQSSPPATLPPVPTPQAATPEPAASGTPGPRPSLAGEPPAGTPGPVPGPEPLPEPAAPTPAPPPAAAGGPGALQQILNAVLPDTYGLGLTLGSEMPVRGIVMMSAPIGNCPTDFTRTDGDPGNTILANLRAAPGTSVPGWPIPKDWGQSALTGAFQAEFESANVGTGSPVLSRFEAGTGFTVRNNNDVLDFTVIGNVRAGMDFAADQGILSFNANVNVPVHQAFGLAADAAAPALLRAPHPLAKLAGAAAKGVGGFAEAIDPWIDKHVGLAAGLGYRGELRFNLAPQPGQGAPAPATPGSVPGPGPAEPTPPPGTPVSFDGLYRDGERVPLPGFVEDAVNQELRSPLMPGAAPLASFAARAARNGANAAAEAVGLPPVETWESRLPPGAMDAGRRVLDLARETQAEFDAGAAPPDPGPLAVPGVGFATRMAANAVEDWVAEAAAGSGLPPWMKGLLGAPAAAP